MAETVHALLAGELARRFPAEAAGEIEAGEPSDAAAFLEARPEGVAGAVLGRLTPERAARVLIALPDEGIRRLLPRLEVTQVIAVLRWLAAPERERVLAIAGAAQARELQRLMAYPPDTAGALMDPRVLAVRPQATVADALARLKGAPREVYQVYVTDADQRIVGTVPVTRLALATPEHTMEPLVDRRRETIDAFATREEVVQAMTSLGVPSLAVVDRDGVLLGVLRHRALVGAAEEEAFADLAAMVGASKDERALSRPTFAVRKRLPWLVINLFTAFLAAAVVGLFEATLARMTALAVLLPVVAGQSGNAGSQALAVTMRGLALREIRSTHWFRLALKEVMVGILNGVAIAAICGAGVLVWSGSLGIAGVITVAMVIAMAAAGLAGASIPLLLMRFGQDPATASSIILTTVTDVVGFLSFLGLATALLR